MSTAAPVRPITAAEFLEMDFNVPVELVRGEIVEMTLPGWKHGGVCSNANRLLGNWCVASKLGRALSNDSGVLTERNPDSLRGPDSLYVSYERYSDQAFPTGVPPVAPNLCIEVLLPSDRWNEVLDKVTEFQSAGVSEVWVIDPEDRIVHLFRCDSGPQQYRMGDNLTSRELPGFECSVSDLFEGV